MNDSFNLEDDDTLTGDVSLQLGYDASLKAMRVINDLLSTQDNNPIPEYLVANAQLILMISMGQFLQEIRNLLVKATDDDNLSSS